MSTKLNNPEDIMKVLMSADGLIERTYGNLLPRIIDNIPFANNMRILHKVYGYSDIYDIFPVPVDDKQAQGAIMAVLQIQKADPFTGLSLTSPEEGKK